jgi:hypothetical protein
VQNLTEKQGDKPVDAPRRRRRGGGPGRAESGAEKVPGHDVDAAQDRMEAARDEPKLERL